jgi:Sulfotransferase family
MVSDTVALPALDEGELKTLLRPILVAGFGRSGTTAVMNLLATDSRVTFDRKYPFENRQLSYFAKLSSILDQRIPDQRFAQDHLFLYEENIFGPRPWGGPSRVDEVEWLRIFWAVFSGKVKRVDPTATFYAEKAPSWLPAIAERVVPCSTIHLFRDPRDVYLSSNAFLKKRNYYGFFRSPQDTDLEHARNMAPKWLNFFENICGEGRPTDSFLARYEDLVLRPEGLVAWLRSQGLDTDLDRAFDHFDDHRTSSDLAASVERWRREAIPPEVKEFFERHLGGEMEALGYPVESAGCCPSIQFRAGEFAPQLTNSSQGRIELTEYAMKVHVTGGDFGLLLPFEPFPAEEVHEIWVSVAGVVGDHFSIYWRGADNDFSEQCAIHLKYAPGPHWEVVRFRMRQHPLWHGTIQQVRLDLFNGQTARTEGSGYVRWVRLIG